MDNNDPEDVMDRLDPPPEMKKISPVYTPYYKDPEMQFYDNEKKIFCLSKNPEGYFVYDSAKDAEWNRMYPMGFTSWAEQRKKVSTSDFTSLCQKVNELIDVVNYEIRRRPRKETDPKPPTHGW